VNTVLIARELKTGQTIQIVQGDITNERADIIVNAANQRLQHGGGVAWAILKTGGDVIQKESDEWIRRYGPVTHARPAWTSAGRLPAKYVIHAVGPIWGEGDEAAKLAEAVSGSLRVADELQAASVALPAISTGVFGFPSDRAADVIFHTIQIYFSNKLNTHIRLVKLVLFDQATLLPFMKIWGDIWGA
jgi:O-acetyl-ADP-ribose deacetylase (regulator of RNase III)